ncbi:MAG TPA: hypothetical protein VK835_01700 [Bacteroidia bacterium]|jgi:hypothetical protein|nr:hypothetical protein [Bacteroidia bacterium]
MKEEKESKPAKKKNPKSLTQSIKISITSHEKLDKFRKKNKLTMKDLVDEIASFVDRPNFSMAIFDDRYELHQLTKEIKEHNKLSNANFGRFADDSLSKMEKHHDNNLGFLTHVVPKLIEIGTQQDIKILVEQNFKLLRALVETEIEGDKAKILLKETLKIVQEPQKSIELTKPAEPEKKDSSPFELIENRRVIVEGTVETISQTEVTENKTLRTQFYIRQPLSSAIEIIHNAILLEGDLTKKLNLVGEENIRAYFNSFSPSDPIKVDGYIITHGKSFYKTYVITDVISHSKRA